MGLPWNMIKVLAGLGSPCSLDSSSSKGPPSHSGPGTWHLGLHPPAGGEGGLARGAGKWLPA